MDKKYKYLIVVLLIIVSLIAFGRILSNGFINLDDNEYITENYHIQSGINLESIKWAFSNSYSNNWHPLTFVSHMLDWSLFGANASGHHLISLLLHIGSVLFLFLFLSKTTGNLWPSAFAAALFSLHPLRVESVAWAAERKDVLSMFFGMASIYAYAFYTKGSKFPWYFLCLILFAMGLMSKQMLVTLPFVLILLDYWPLERWQKVIYAPVNNRSHATGMLIWEKAPFLLLTIASSIVTFWAQNKGGIVAKVQSFLNGAIQAIISYAAYLGKIFWPVNLAVFYPYEFSVLLWKFLISCLILIAITVVALYYMRKLPFLFVGWFWYVGTLVPVIGFVQLSDLEMADRYTYLPSVGIAIMLAWGIPSLFHRAGIRKKVLFPAAITVLAILVVLTWKQCGYWKNSIELFSHTLHVTKDNYLAHNNRGNAYVTLGQYQRAFEDFDEALRLKPNYAKYYDSRGTLYFKLGQYQRAFEDFNEALRLQPNYANAYDKRGAVYVTLGQYQRAFEDFNEALRLNPNYANAYNNRAVVYFKQGNNKHACSDLQKACALGNRKVFELAKSEGLCR